MTRTWANEASIDPIEGQTQWRRTKTGQWTNDEASWASQTTQPVKVDNDPTQPSPDRQWQLIEANDDQARQTMDNYCGQPVVKSQLKAVNDWQWPISVLLTVTNEGQTDNQRQWTDSGGQTQAVIEPNWTDPMWALLKRPMMKGNGQPTESQDWQPSPGNGQAVEPRPGRTQAKVDPEDRPDIDGDGPANWRRTWIVTETDPGPVDPDGRYC